MEKAIEILERKLRSNEIWIDKYTAQAKFYRSKNDTYLNRLADGCDKNAKMLNEESHGIKMLLDKVR